MDGARYNAAMQDYRPESSERILRVSELNRRTRLLLEREFPQLWVCGEISGLTRAASGHLYFTLKDADAQVRCVMFRSRAALLPFEARAGLQVEARAVVSLYEARGDFQLGIEAMRPAGVGNLHEAFCRLRERLQSEGLFDPARKRALPRFPQRIGLLTSAQGAALHDMLSTLRRRAPQIGIMIYPCLVQGQEAPAALRAALGNATRRNECDLLILARGGGSMEDLWAFNDEALARAIAASPLPVVSGVGHETDFTIADFVADLRAATPTAAAELVSQHWVEAAQRFDHLAPRLGVAMHNRLARDMQKLDDRAARLASPARQFELQRRRLALLSARLSHARQRTLAGAQQALHRVLQRLQGARPELPAARWRLAQSEQRLATATRRMLEQRRHRLHRLADQLQALNPHAVLERGFSIVRNADGSLRTSVEGLQPGIELEIEFAHGTARTRVESTRKR